MLGTDLCQELSGDYDIAGLDCQLPDALQTSGFTNIQCDITNREKTIEAIASAKPGIVIHAAAWTDVDGCELDPRKADAVNAGGTGNVALACEKIKAPLVYVSTDFVFDGRKNGPYNEKDVPAPLSAYGSSKLEGEKKLAVLKEHVIIRTGWLFGRNGKNFIKAILDIAAKRKKIEVVDDQRGCPTYTPDLAKAIYVLLGRLLKRGFGKEIFHISNKGIVSWFDYAREIIKLAGLETEIAPIKSSALKRPAPRPANSALDTSGFEKFTGCRMRGWQEALKEYLDEGK